MARKLPTQLGSAAVAVVVGVVKVSSIGIGRKRVRFYYASPREENEPRVHCLPLLLTERLRECILSIFVSNCWKTKQLVNEART